MRGSYLQVTFHHGRPLAAYLYLPREAGVKSVRTCKVSPGIVVDFGSSDRALGIELTAPAMVTLAALNEVLEELSLPPLSAADIQPLRAA